MGRAGKLQAKDIIVTLDEKKFEPLMEDLEIFFCVEDPQYSNPVNEINSLLDFPKRKLSVISDADIKGILKIKGIFQIKKITPVPDDCLKINFLEKFQLIMKIGNNLRKMMNHRYNIYSKGS